MAAAVVTFAVIVAAAVMTFAVIVMMIAMEVFADFQIAGKESLHHFAHIAFRTADDFNTVLCEGIDGSAADPAANEQFDLFIGKKRCKRTVSGFTAGNTAFAQDLSGFHFKNGKFGRVTEMLEYFIVFASYSDLCHIIFLHDY